jgi:hypothetical protein
MPETRIRPTAHALSGLWLAVSKSIATKVGGLAEVAKESDLGTITAIPYSRLSWMKGVIPLRAYGMFFQPETVDVIARYSSSSRIKAFIQEGLTLNPVTVLVPPIYPSIISKVLSGFPSQFLLIKLNSRCSTGFHFEHPVG